MPTNQGRSRRKSSGKGKAFLRVALILCVIAAGGLLLYKYVLKDDVTPPAATEPVDATTPAEDTTVIHFAAAGDLNVTEQSVKAGGSDYDYTNTFMDVAHLLSNADVAALNFEGNFCGEPYGKNRSAPQAMAEALQKAGVDFLQMANSYSINRGVAGLGVSMEAVRDAGMEPLGVYATNEAYKEEKGYIIRNVQGVRIAFMAFTKGMSGDNDSMTLPPNSEDCVNVLYSDYDSTFQNVNKTKINTVLSAAKKEKPDLIIALLHWGSEYNDTISKSQESIVKIMQEGGVDAIIGTHSHYVQKIDFNKETGKVVAYSLGDFVSGVPLDDPDSRKAGSWYSVVLDLEITKNNKTGETKITNCTYTPVYTVQEEGKPLQVMRIRETMAAYENGYLNRVSDETYTKMAYALQRIEARVAGE